MSFFFFSSSRRLTPGVLHFSSSSSEWDERTASLSLARFHNSRRRYTRSISLSLHYVRRCSPLQQARRLLGERPLGGEALDFRSVDSFSVVDVVIVVVVVASSSPPWLSFARFLPRGRSRSHAAGRALHPGPAHGRVCDPSRSGSPRSGSRSGRWRRRPPPAEGPARFALAADGRQDCLLGHAGEVPFFFESCYLPRDAEKQRRRKTGRNREKKKRKSRATIPLKGQFHEIFDHFFGLKDSTWALNRQRPRQHRVSVVNNYADTSMTTRSLFKKCEGFFRF